MLIAGLLALVGCPGPVSKPGIRRKVTMPVFSAEELAAAEPVAVVAGTPVGNVERLGEADEIAVTFDQPMVELGAIPDTVDFPLLLEPDIPGTCHWLGTRTVVFRPDTVLPPATEFTVRVPKGVRAVGGEMLKQDHSFGFSTVRPKLLYSLPYHNQEMVELDHWVYLKFNVPMDPGRARSYIKLVEPDGAEQGFSLRHPRPTERAETWWYNDVDSANVLVLIPKGRLSIQTRYEVVLEEGLQARAGNLGTIERRTLEFETFNRFKFQGVADADSFHPEDALSFTFSNPVPMQELAASIRFRPQLEIPREYLSRTYASKWPSLGLAFQPETTYEVELSRWLKDRFGNRLGHEVTFTLRTVSYRPSVNMATGPGIVESEFPPLFPVWLTNVDSLRVRMRRLRRSEVIPFWRGVYDRYWYEESEDRPFDRPGFFTHDRVWKPRLVRNERAVRPLVLKPGLGGEKAGYLFCELEAPQVLPERRRFRRALLQVIPYALTAKFSPENGLAYVSRLRNGSPIVDADLELRDDDNRVVWRGRTGDDGFAFLPGWDELGLQARDRWRTPRLWLFAEGPWGESFIHSEWGTGIYPYDFGIYYDWNPDPSEPRGFIYTEKGLYRAGDTVHVKGIIRGKKRGRWVIPGVRRGDLVVMDSRGEELVDRQTVLSSWGGFDVDVPLPGEATSGYYSVRFELDGESFSGSFRVEAYRPAEFQVEVDAEQEEYVAGETFEAMVSGRYLFGGPMSEDRVDWWVSLAPASYRPPDHPGFRWGASMAEADEGHRELASGAAKLDGNGDLQVKARLDPGSGLGPRRVTCEASVTAANERSIAGRGSWLVHRAEAYVGVRVKDDFIQVADSLGCEVLVVKPNGEVLDGSRVDLTVFRREWKSARKAQTGGRYSWVSEKRDVRVAHVTIKTGEEPAEWWFTPDRPGMYWLKCETTDDRRNPARTDARFWVTGAGPASWQMRDDDLIELVRDKDSYVPGDTARILVKSPWSRVLAVVTVEREYVLDYFTAGLFGTAEVVEVPIKEEYLPNVFVSVMLLKGRTALNEFNDQGEDLGKPGFKMGYVELPVEPDAKKLNVSVLPDRQEYRPRDTVTVDLLVRDKSGRGREAEVSLAAVDLGVLKLTGYATPDPFRVFYRPRPLSVATAETRLHVIGQRNYGEKGEAAGGDGELEGERMENGRGRYGFSYREKFLETALWLPSVRTDDEGRASVTFELPDNLTTWQLMAVACGVEYFGSGDTSFRANKPLLVKPSLPRFVRPDDEFRAGVMVHNRTDTGLDVEVSCEASEGAILSGDRTRTVRVEPNRATEVLFEFRCPGGDSARFEFRAGSGREQDGLRLALPVHNPHVTEAVAVYEQTTDSLALQWLEAPEDVFSGVGGLEVTVASSGLSGLERGVEYLREYPYECLEQRLSKVLPFITGEELINTFELSELTGEELREFVRGQLAAVPRFQDESGGFHFWPNRRYWWRPSPYLSAYCMYALARARDAGYEPDEKTVTRGKAYLANWLSGIGRDEDWPYSVNEFQTTRCLAVYALSLWGGNIGSHVSTLMDRLDQISVFGKAYLLKAIDQAETGASVGYDERVVQALNNKVKLAPTTAHYEEEHQGGWLFHSNVRTTAFVLQALLETRGEVEFAEKAVRWLVLERKSGRWRTTQENVYVFDALATFYRVYEKVEPDFTATVKLEQREILSRVFSGRSLATGRRFVPIDSLNRGVREQVRVEKDGPGRLYYGLRLSYAPKGELEPKDEGLRVEKSIRPVKGGRGYVRGEQYLVTLRVYTPQERLYVVVDDPLPAGFEVVNTSFETESRASGRELAAARRSNRGSRWWGSFDHEEIYDDRYVLFATSLTRGWHERTYLVKALTEGTFLMPATKAEEMYTPEVFGYTKQQVIEVGE